jgi:hypothetical protein
MSGILALLMLAPLGAIAGLVLGTTLATRLRGGENTCTLLRNSLKAVAVVVALCVAAGTPYYFYAVTTATPRLNPNAATPLLVFEVRLPAGAALPNSPRDIAIELQTDSSMNPARSMRVSVPQYPIDGPDWRHYVRPIGEPPREPMPRRIVIQQNLVGRNAALPSIIGPGIELASISASGLELLFCVIG